MFQLCVFGELATLTEMPSKPPGLYNWTGAGVQGANDERCSHLCELVGRQQPIFSWLAAVLWFSEESAKTIEVLCWASYCSYTCPL